MALVLSRQEKEVIRIGDNVVITVQQLRRNAVKLAIEAPKEVLIVRGELPALTEKVDEASNTG